MLARSRLRFVFPLLAAAALGLGMWGFVAGHGDDWHVAALRTLQLFVMEGDADLLGERWPTTLAALLAPLATLGATVYLLGDVLRRRWQLLGLWFRPADELFLGSGQRAAAIAARQLRPGAAQAPRVVGLDQDEHAPLAGVLAGTGRGFVVRGDARSAAELRRVRALSARNVWVMTASDELNLDIARSVLALGAPRAGACARLLVRVDDAQLLRANLVPRGAGGAAHVEFFNMNRLAARVLWENHPPALPPVQERGDEAPGFARPAHVAIVGGGDLASALAEHAIVHWVLDDRPQYGVHVTLIGRDAPALRRALLLRHPALDTATSARHSALAPLLPLATLTACRADEAGLSPARWAGLQRHLPFDAVYVAVDNDLLAGRVAARILALRDAFGGRRDLPVVTTLQGMATGEAADPFDAAGHAWFRVYDRCVQAGTPYPGAAADARAVLINRAYGRAGGERGPLTDADVDAALQEWLALDEPFRWSNRCAGDHYSVKQACLAAFASAPDRLPLPLRGDALRTAIAAHEAWLVRLEHRRFVVERLFDGWLPRPGDAGEGTGAPSGMDRTSQKRVLRLNETLVPFEALCASVANIDQRIVAEMADVLENAARVERRLGMAAEAIDE